MSWLHVDDHVLHGEEVGAEYLYSDPAWPQLVLVILAWSPKVSFCILYDLRVVNDGLSVRLELEEQLASVTALQPDLLLARVHDIPVVGERALPKIVPVRPLALAVVDESELRR